jgi:RNase P subunit RPR2
MKYICQHCDTLTEGLAYRVRSEEAGVILLNMIVCHSCFEQAKDLELDVKEVSQEI